MRVSGYSSFTRAVSSSPVIFGISNVGDEHLWPETSYSLKGLLPIGKSSEDLNVWFDREQRGERAPQHALVLSQHHAYPLCHNASAFSANRGVKGAADSHSSGKVISRDCPRLAEPASFTTPATD